MNEGDAAANTGDIMRRLADLEREVRELRAERRLQASAIDASRGSLRVQDGGKDLLRIGDLGGGYRGTAIRRRTGQSAIVSQSNAPDDPGFIGFYDLSDNYILTDDVKSKRGLGRPYLEAGMADSLSYPTATVSGSTWISIATGWSGLENPVLQVYFIYRSDNADTVGDLQMTIDGVQVGPVQHVNGGDWAYGSIGPFAHGQTQYGLHLYQLDLMARRTAGTGSIGARVLSVVGLESAWI